MISTSCPSCGSTHFGPCATQETCFIWIPKGLAIPHHVLIVGSWHQWQAQEELSKETMGDGKVFFEIKLMLLSGQYQYRYIIDGVWEYSQNDAIVRNQFGSFNNFIRVYPKKMYVPLNKDGQIRISSNLSTSSLEICGSWDNWKESIKMEKVMNHLKARQQYVAYVSVEADKQYEFKFKIGDAFQIDEKYPTAKNIFNSTNNVIIAFSQDNSSVGSEQLEFSETPNRTKKKVTSSYKSSFKDFSCTAFEFMKIDPNFQLPYERVEGHSMCSLGSFIYIFGGYCRSEYYNSLTKINSKFTTASEEEALPNGRAFHNMVTFGNKLIIYGGCNREILEDYYAFNATSEKWMGNPIISGKYPVKKEKQSCVIYDMLLVFFGGYYCSPDFEYEVYYQDISVLDIENMKWIQIIAVNGEQPKGRFAHKAALIQSDMYIFGGTYNAVENLNLNDIWKINLEKVKELTWVQIHPKGKLPTPRRGHSINAISHYLIVFGGQDNHRNYLNDVVVFNTTDEEWLYPIIYGEIPRARYYHASTVNENDEILIFGGRCKNKEKNEHFYVLKPAIKIPLLIDEHDDE